jgi:hypothetical protein
MARFDNMMRQHPSFAIGVAAAQDDISRGHLAYRVYGKNPGGWQDLAQALHDEYQVALEVVGGGFTFLEIAAEAEGYNERMGTEFQVRFGDDIVGSVIRKVERKRKKKS